MKAHGDSGFSAPIILLAMSILVIGIGGISVDLWRVLSDYREVAGLVDGAAAAGATAIDETALYEDPDDIRLDPSLALDRTCDYLATRAGVPRGACPGPTVEVLVTQQTVGVSLQRDVDLTLLRLLTAGAPNGDRITVSSSSVVSIVRGLP